MVEQFLFDHGTKSEFIEQYEHLDLDCLRWTLEQLPAGEFAQVTWALESLGGRVVECEHAPGLHLEQRPPDQQARWRERGTWITPPVLIDAGLLSPPRNGLHLVEGHTRVGILRGRVASGAISLEQTHAAYVGRRRLAT